MLAHMNYVHDKAKIGNNVTIKAFATIHEGVIIGDDCIIEDGARIYENCVIGKGSIIGASAVLRSRTIIGNNCIFGTLSCSEGDCKIGHNTTIHAQCHITKEVEIGNNVFIAPFFIASNTVNITSGAHGTSLNRKAPKTLPTIIEDNVRIGACIRMIPGLTIGHDSLIDMDCLLTHNIPPHSHVRAEGKSHVGRVKGQT